jgi:hypothetical protein
MMPLSQQQMKKINFVGVAKKGDYKFTYNIHLTKIITSQLMLIVHKCNSFL